MRGRIHFLGYRHDVSRLMRTIDIVVQPSRIEAGPIVPLEAMATEVPVIATSVGAIPEEVLNDINGILVPAEDPVSMAKAIETLINNPENRKCLGKSARKLVKNNFDLSKRSIELSKIYTSLIR